MKLSVYAFDHVHWFSTTVHAHGDAELSGLHHWSPAFLDEDPTVGLSWKLGDDQVESTSLHIELNEREARELHRRLGVVLDQLPVTHRGCGGVRREP